MGMGTDTAPELPAVRAPVTRPAPHAYVAQGPQMGRRPANKIALDDWTRRYLRAHWRWGNGAQCVLVIQSHYRRTGMRSTVERWVRELGLSGKRPGKARVVPPRSSVSGGRSSVSVARTPDYTLESLAAALAVPPARVGRWLADGDLHGARDAHGVWRVSEGDLRAFMARYPSECWAAPIELEGWVWRAGVLSGKG